jgi:glyoxylase-like metal-dependent hydrolase (beta-lactamase superfamily II)
MSESVTVGNVTIDVVLDMAAPPFDPNQFFPDVPLESWDAYRADHLDEDGKFRTNFCGWVLRSSGQTVLVDTGLGAGPHERLGGGRGQLLTKLGEMGVNPEDISTVVITHLHGDHIGWNVTDDGGQKRATFPKARYLVPKGDWDHFTQPEVLAAQAAVQNHAVPLLELGALDLVEGDHAVTPEITTLFTPGHTPGHLSVLVNSGGEKAIVVGDLFHNSVQITEVDWCAGADLDKEVARTTRRATFDRLEQEGFIIAAGHLPVGHSIGKIARLESRRYWQAI